MRAYCWCCKLAGQFYLLGPVTFSFRATREQAQEYFEDYIGRVLDPETEGVCVPTGEKVFD